MVVMVSESCGLLVGGADDDVLALGLVECGGFWLLTCVTANCDCLMLVVGGVLGMVAAAPWASCCVGGCCGLMLPGGGGLWFASSGVGFAVLVLDGGVF